MIDLDLMRYIPKKYRPFISHLVAESDYDYDKNRTIQRYFVELTNGMGFNVTSIKELKATLDLMI